MIATLNIPGSQATPFIQGEPEAGLLRMRGDSYPENAFEVYAPVIHWVEAMLSQPAQPLQVELELLYLNTSSIKALMDIFDLIEAAHQAEHPVSVTWYYHPDNERVGELADEFREDCSFPFDILPRT